MTSFSCPRCGYITSMIGNLHLHFKRKKPCLPKLLDIPFESLCHFYYMQQKEPNNSSDDKSVAICSLPIESKKHKCKFCDKSYMHSSSMYKHMRKVHQANNTEGILSVDDNKTTIIHNHTTNNTTNNTILIIQNFGNENTSYLTDDYLANRLKQPKKGISDIIRQIHFNPGRPENHNIKITNKKLPYASVFSAGSWKLEDKKKVINQMIDKSYCIMDNVYNDYHKSLMPSTRRQFETFQNRYGELKKDLERTTELQILNEQKIYS